MTSREELVGRPLVPFFDAHENVNETLRVDPSTQTHETFDVDARVWDRELGYFVYPNEDPSRSRPKPQPRQHSQPIAIKKAPSTPTAADAGKRGLLLTPDMLSRSAPTPSPGKNGFSQPPPSPHTPTAASTPRSASAKRSSRQKSRSGTPRRSRNKKQQPATSDGTASSDSSDKEKPPKLNNSRSKKSPEPKEELSANGKWAWSAFQSSPDPKSLPLPPFAGGSPSIRAMPPPLDPPKIEERLDPPRPEDPARPENPPRDTIEHSMTQDLRRMLNLNVVQ